MKTKKQPATADHASDRARADRIAGYRARGAAASVPDQVQALEARWAAMRAGSDEAHLSDHAFFQQALVLAATPASTAEDARTRQAFLLCYVRIDAVEGGHRLIATMIDAAIAEDRRQWCGPNTKQA